MQQNHRVGLAGEMQDPIQGGVAAAADDQILACVLLGILHAVRQLRAFELLDAVDLDGARLERANTSGDENGFGDEACTSGGFEIEAAVFAFVAPV